MVYLVHETLVRQTWFGSNLLDIATIAVAVCYGQGYAIVILFQ